MNIKDLIPYLGGIVPGMMSPGSLNIDPRALLIGGMLPGVLNESTGGTPNLSTVMSGAMPGMLNEPGGQDSETIKALLQRMYRPSMPFTAYGMY